MQWQEHRLKRSSFDNKNNFTWPRKRSLENETKF